MSAIQQYQFELTGVSACLFHRDDVEAADQLKEWRKHPDNKAKSVAGDDRSPAWTWMTYLYHDGEKLAIPFEVIMASLRYAGAQIKTGQGQKTFKAISQSGLLIADEFCEFRFGEKPRELDLATLFKFRDEPFSVHAKTAQSLGFSLLVKRAAVDKKKHVRVRAKFDSWTVRGTIQVLDPQITETVLAQMFAIAGQYAGILDWRPSSPKSPGPYGKYSARLKRAG